MAHETNWLKRLLGTDGERDVKSSAESFERLMVGEAALRGLRATAPMGALLLLWPVHRRGVCVQAGRCQ